MAWPWHVAGMQDADGLFVRRRSLTRSFGLRPQDDQRKSPRDDNAVVTLSAAKGLALREAERSNGSGITRRRSQQWVFHDEAPIATKSLAARDVERGVG